MTMFVWGREMKVYVRLEFECAGISVDEAAEDMVFASKYLGFPTMASFNGVWLRAEPSSAASDVVKQYMADIKFQRDAERQLGGQDDGKS